AEIMRIVSAFLLWRRKERLMENSDQKGRIAQSVRQWWDELFVSPPPGETYAGTNWPSIEEYAPSVELVLYFVRQACPDSTFIIEEILREQEQAMVRWQLRGIDTQGFQGRVPTNRQITMTGIHMVRE